MSTATLQRPPDHHVEPRSSVADWLRLARAGLIVMVVFAVALQATARAIIPPVAVIGLVCLGFVAYLKGERRWLGLAAAVFVAAAALGNLSVIVDALRHPESAPAFIIQMISMVGVFLTIAGGVGAITSGPTSLIRGLAVAAVGVFVVGSLASVAAAGRTDTAVALPGDVQVTAEQLMWSPEAITVASSASGIWIDNRDGIRHTFTIPELGIDIEVPALKARRVDLAAAPGTYQIICTVPGHESMTGTLTISG